MFALQNVLENLGDVLEKNFKSVVGTRVNHEQLLPFHEQNEATHFTTHLSPVAVTLTPFTYLNLDVLAVSPSVPGLTFPSSSKTDGAGAVSFYLVSIEARHNRGSRPEGEREKLALSLKQSPFFSFFSPFSVLIASHLSFVSAPRRSLLVSLLRPA